MAPRPAIATCCDSILSLNARLGRDFARLLVEGLPRAQILTSARQAGLLLPDEVVDLFAWRNGHRDGHSMGNMWLLPGYYLLGLEEALGHRAAGRGHVPDSWLPLLSDGGAGAFVVECAGPRAGAVLHHDPQDVESGMLAFPGLGGLLAAVEEALSSGAFSIGEGGFLDQDDTRWYPIAARHAAGAPFWQRLLENLDEWVYVPAPGSTPTLEISLPAKVRQGDWFELKARRNNGRRWSRVRRRDLTAEQVGAHEVPPAIEDDVQAMLAWTVHPDGTSECDSSSIDGDPWQRRMRFHEPGVYAVRGHSAYPAPVHSEIVEVTVLPRPKLV
jgi:hypothetical protein